MPMDRSDVSWCGYWAACPTPFREDESYDAEAHRALLDWYVGEGLHGVLINGTTGEWFAQTPGERKQVAENAIDAVGGRIPVVIGCTAYTAREASDIGRHAVAAGADGIEATAPPYSKPFDDEIVAYYEEISASVDAPLMVYNWPHGTSVDMGPDLCSRLADIETIVALKDSTPDVEQFYETARTVVDRLRVFGPFMTTEGFETLKRYGGDGYIGGGTIFGAPDAEFWEAYWRGDEDVCLAHAKRIDDLFPRLWLPGGWAGFWGGYQSQLKAIMKMLGQPGGEPRRPRLPVAEADLPAIREILVEAGLLKEHAAA
jgi:dihydrodipicolinate synthase/N-acetylneuraminate lyase